MRLMMKFRARVEAEAELTLILSLPQHRHMLKTLYFKLLDLIGF